MRTLLAPLSVFVALAAIAGDGRGATLYMDYVANPAATVPAGVWDPLLLGWVSNYATGAGSPSLNEGGLGLNAWRITDAAAALPNPSYVTALNAAASAEALRSGFRLEAKARYVTDYGGGPSLGLSMYLNQRAYHLLLDLDAAGDLQATLHGRAGGAQKLTSGGSGTAAFHTFALESTGGANITALFDGRSIGSWPGTPLSQAHADIALWGNSNQAFAGRGVMAFNRVRFDVGSTVELSGDFNNDAKIDGADFLAWQRTLGSTSQLAADANGDGTVNGADLGPWRETFGTTTTPAALGAAGVPEPTAAVIAAALVAGWSAVACAPLRRPEAGVPRPS